MKKWLSILLFVMVAGAYDIVQPYPPTPKVIILQETSRVILPPTPAKVVSFDYGKINRTNYLWRLMATQDLEHWFQVVYKASDLDKDGILTISKAYGDNLFYKMEGKPK